MDGYDVRDWCGAGIGGTDDCGRAVSDVGREFGGVLDWGHAGGCGDLSGVGVVGVEEGAGKREMGGENGGKE